MGAGQRRHCHRRPGIPIQRLRLPEAPGPPPGRIDAGRQSVPARIRTRVRRARALRLDHADALWRHCRRAVHLRSAGRQLSSLRRQLRERRERRPRRERGLGWCGGRVRRRRSGGGCRDVERRSSNRSRRRLRDGHAEHATRGGSDAWPFGARPVGARPRFQSCGAAHESGRHVRGPVHRSVARLRSGPYRVCVHIHGGTGPRGIAYDFRRQRIERNLRSARRVSDSDPRRNRRAKT